MAFANRTKNQERTMNRFCNEGNRSRASNRGDRFMAIPASRRHRLVGASLAVFALAAAGCEGGPDSGLEGSTASVSIGEPTRPHCAVLVDRLRPGETESRILAQQCADTEEELASSPVFAGATVLMIVYVNADYGGSSKVFYGGAPCDAAGYGVSDVGADFRNRISSFQGFNKCNSITGFMSINYGGSSKPWENRGASTLAVHWVGSVFNDKLRSFKLRNR
jgi:hypothetical protein